MIRGWLDKFRFRRYRLGEVIGLLRTPLGRSEIWYVFLHFAWPVTSRLAALYRRLLLRRVPIVAVVGTFGKTTTSRAIGAALGKSIGSRDEPNARATTPGALFRIRPGGKAAVLEIGINGPGQMAAIARTVQPDIVVVTSIGSEHNRSFKSLDTTRDEKAHMVRVLPPSGAAVLNGDDPNVLWMAGLTPARVVTFGFGEDNQVRASDPRLEWPGGMRFRLHAAGEEREVRLRLLGRHMVYPALAAVAVAMLRGERLDEVLSRLAALSPAVGRLTPRPLARGAVLLCDTLKSGLETIHAALDVLAEIPASRKIVVLGPISEPPGPQGPMYRELGNRIARIAQLAVFVDSYREYEAGVRQAGMPRAGYVDAGHGISGAVKFLRRELRPGDVALIKGRAAQKLERIALALEDRPVRCRLIACRVQSIQCDHCPMLLRFRQ
jgi:UDP-N-acetylmuramyl pentapeptide synthase